MRAFPELVAEAGGPRAPRERSAQLRALLERELVRGAGELVLPRSGYGQPVAVAAAPGAGRVLAVAPVDPALRADPATASERGWLLVAALVGALVEVTGATGLSVGALAPHGLALALPARDDEAEELAELLPLAFAEQVAPVQRLRATAVALPAAVLAEAEADLRPPLGAAHPLRAAEAIAHEGGRPADPAAAERLEDLLLARAGVTLTRPHEDPDPARRVARRIVQRLAGMGKWGGYHTEFAHLARGFAGNERRLAEEVGEALLDAGVLLEKPSVGQRHVFLNPRRARDVYALVDEGTLPPDLLL